MKIGIDLDDVVVDFFPSFLNFYNAEYEKNFRFEDINNYHIWEVGIGENKEEAIALVDEFYDSSWFEKIPVVEGAEKGVEELLRLDKKLKIITSRPLRFREKTNNFFKRYFSDLKLGIYYSSGLHQQGGTKADICKREGIDIFIEDCLKYAEECAENGVRVLLLDKPWNQEGNGKVERVYNWDEILEKINESKKEGEKDDINN